MMARCPMNVANAYWFWQGTESGAEIMKDNKVSVGLGDGPGSSGGACLFDKEGVRLPSS